MAHDIVFSEQARELQAQAREIADKYVRPLAAKYDKAQEYNFEAAKACAEGGLFKVFIPEEYGGYGAGSLALCLVTEELAKAGQSSWGAMSAALDQSRDAFTKSIETTAKNFNDAMKG